MEQGVDSLPILLGKGAEAVTFAVDHLPADGVIGQGGVTVVEFIVRYARICPFVPLLFIQVAEELRLLLLGEGNVYATASDIKAGDGSKGGLEGDSCAEGGEQECSQAQTQ